MARLDQSGRQLRLMCMDFVRLFYGRQVDARSLTKDAYSRWGLLVDWHEFADALNELDLAGEVERAGSRDDGLSIWLVKQ